jgi:hypothetical protein
MCEKCIELDTKIERYERLARNISDQRTIAGIRKMVAELKAERAALHREQET